MPTPHPGQWELLLNQSGCELSTQEPAVHSSVVVPDLQSQRWKILYFFGGNRSFLWDPLNPQTINELPPVPNWPPPAVDPPNLFCSGHSFMPDGRLLVAGGLKGVDPSLQPLGLPYAYIFAPLVEEWNYAGYPGEPQAMAHGRYYPTLTTLGEDPGYGKILAMSGNLDNVAERNKDPELYDPNTGWSMMANPPQARQPFDDWYPAAHLIPFGTSAGKIFYSTPMRQAWKFNPFFDGKPNGGYWEPVGQQRTQVRHHSNSVLLPLIPGSTSQKILIIGGAETEFGSAVNTTEMIDLSNAVPQWTSANPMLYARINANGVILPNDTILVVGGNERDQSEAAIFTAEIYNVETGLWSVVAPMRRRRAYHSTSLLLPDGRVWVSGTVFRHPAVPEIEIRESNIEIYSPGYIFEGERPEFVQQPPDVINYGSVFAIATTTAIAAIRLIQLGSVTHSVDMDQRSVGLSFVSGPLNHAHPYEVTAPANANIAPPGLYMLFVLRPKSASQSGETMIPSVAKIVKLER